MVFQEYTASDGSNEVMIDVDVKSGKIVDVYTYADCRIEHYSDKLEDFVDLTKSWKTQSNRLFVHCPPNQRKFAVLTMLTNDFSICSGTDDLDEIERDMDIIHKMVTYYKLPSECEDALVVA